MPDSITAELLFQHFDLVADEDESFVFHLIRKEGTPSAEAEILKNALRLESLVVPEDSRITARTHSFRICAEGDSWINILWPVSKVKGYEPTFVDIIDEDSRFYVRNIGWPGDEFDDIVRDQQYEQPIKSGSFDFFILSGGGNDFLGGGALTRYIRDYSTLPLAAAPEDCIREVELAHIFRRIATGYSKILAQANVWSSGTHILLQGYDNALPRPNGPWLWEPFTRMNYDLGSNLPAKIIALVVERFYKLLEETARNYRHAHVIDVRGCCRNNWHDELHPNFTASARIADKFINKMLELKGVA